MTPMAYLRFHSMVFIGIYGYFCFFYSHRVYLNWFSIKLHPIPVMGELALVLSRLTMKCIPGFVKFLPNLSSNSVFATTTIHEFVRRGHFHFYNLGQGSGWLAREQSLRKRFRFPPFILHLPSPRRRVVRSVSDRVTAKARNSPALCRSNTADCGNSTSCKYLVTLRGKSKSDDSSTGPKVFLEYRFIQSQYFFICFHCNVCHSPNQRIPILIGL